MGFDQKSAIIKPIISRSVHNHLCVLAAAPMAENEKPSKIIIEGVTESGEAFRPSDWAERMSGRLSTFNKHGLHYSPLLQPSTRDGRKCILLDPKLALSNPTLYHSILNFAKENKLKICDDEPESTDES